MPSLTITEGDLGLMGAIADPGRLEEPGEPLPRSLLHDLAVLVPCDDVVWISSDTYRHLTLGIQGIMGPDPDSDHAGMRTEIDATFWDNFWHWGHSRPERTGDLSAFRPADEPIGRERARALQHYYSLIGPRHQVTVPLAVRAGTTHELLFLRYDGHDFSDREVLLLTLIRPHLSELNAELLRRQAVPGRLTSRQRQVLDHVAAGLTNRQISRRLGISEGTVRKHLENIFTSLGASDRTSAVLLASTSPPRNPAINARPLDADQHA